MFLFGINFSCYYLLLLRQFRSVFKDEELRMYVGVAVLSVVLITFNIRDLYGTLGETVRHAAFQVSSIMTTTGFATTDFDLWPSFSKAILMMLMVVGACAGSTGGGLKCIRVLLLFKILRRNIRQLMNPRKVQVVRSNGKAMDEKVLDNVNAYLAAYVIIIIISYLLISLDGFSVGTNLTAVLATFNNIGPGLEAVGPTCNFGGFSTFSKLVLIADMLAGRLEIFPMLVLITGSTWKRK
jgi:trk system potassium uptake protein TrkH